MGVASVTLVVLGVGLLFSGTAAPPSAPGAVRISLEVREDTPVAAQPAQLEDTPAGCTDDVTSFSASREKTSKKDNIIKVNLGWK